MKKNKSKFSSLIKKKFVEKNNLLQKEHLQQHAQSKQNVKSINL